MSGEYLINVMEPKIWDDIESTVSKATAENDKGSVLSQHISFLRDFFRSYKDFTDGQIDTLEIICAKLYESFGITNCSDIAAMKPDEFPILFDLYRLLEDEYQGFDDCPNQLYTKKPCVSCASDCTPSLSVRSLNSSTDTPI